LAAGPNRPANGGAVRPAHEPVTAQDFVDRGYARLQADSLDEAKADFERAGTLNPHWSRPLAGRAVVLIRRRDLEGAQPLLRLALAARARIHAWRNEADPALADVNAIVALDPHDPQNLYQRATIMRRIGRAAAANAAYAETLAAVDARVAAAPNEADDYQAMR